MFPANRRGAILFNSIIHIGFMNWMQFAKGILVANKYILGYSVFNLFLIQHVYLTTVLCISFIQTIPKIVPCSLLPSAFTDTALVKVPGFLKQTLKDCFQLDLFTFLKVFFFNFWDNISLTCSHTYFSVLWIFLLCSPIKFY